MKPISKLLKIANTVKNNYKNQNKLLKKLNHNDILQPNKFIHCFQLHLKQLYFIQHTSIILISYYNINYYW
jgi:hypothetical protein